MGLLAGLSLLMIQLVTCSIPGPRSIQDNIAIVGAGPAGIHMALLLKKKGFEKVTILEKTKAVGGKSWTVNYKNAVHEMGTVYLSPDYVDSVVPLLQKYTPNNLVPLPSAAIWLDNKSEAMPFNSYIISSAMTFLGTSDVNAVVSSLISAVGAYIDLHEDLFGTYEGEIMPQPSKEVMSQINGTFLSFLKRNDLQVLTPLLYVTNTMQGYGQLDEVPCLYGLIWNTPQLLHALLTRLQGDGQQNGLWVLKNGFQNFWQTIVDEEKLTVEFDIRIIKVRRNALNSYQDVNMLIMKGGRLMRVHYDFLIWSPEMGRSLKYWRNKEITNEQNLFRRSTEVSYFTTSLVKLRGVFQTLSPIEYFMDNLASKRQGSLWAIRDSYKTINGVENPIDKNNTRTVITYQMSKALMDRHSLRKKLSRNLQNIGIKVRRVIKSKSWRYFPRYSNKELMNGYLWRVIEMQGQYGMWYIGSSVCFESVKSVIEYNKMLVDNMVAPSDIINTQK